MAFWGWSRTANSNALVGAVNYQEGQAPSSINDSGRALMADLRSWADDISGAIVTGGTSTSLTVTSYQTFGSLGNLANQVVAFTPHTTNGGATTLNVDGLGAKPLRTAPSTELVAGHLIQGTPYTCTYSSGDQAFYLHGFFGNPYSIPIGGLLPFTGTTAPNSSFVLPYGQAISRSTYSAYFGMAGTTYGVGDGSTTFNVPDLRGRVAAGKDDMGGSAASRLTSTYYGTSAAALGAVGGGQSHALVAGEIPTITATNASQAISVTTSNIVVKNGEAMGASGSGGLNSLQNVTLGQTAVSTGTNSISATYTNGSQTQVGLIQPTIVLNYLLRII